MPLGSVQTPASHVASAKWPVLCTVPTGATAEIMLHAILPAVLARLQEQPRANIDAEPFCMPHAIDGAEYTLWWQYIDERVLLLLAVTGRSKMFDPHNGQVATLLKDISRDLMHDRIPRAVFLARTK